MEIQGQEKWQKRWKAVMAVIRTTNQNRQLDLRAIEVMEMAMPVTACNESDDASVASHESDGDEETTMETATSKESHLTQQVKMLRK